MVGMFEFTGARFCFTAVQGVPTRILLSFRSGEEAFDVSDATWSAKLAAIAGESRQGQAGMTVSHAGSLGKLLLYVPPLQLGRYEYEVYAASSAGDVDRIFYGILTVVTSQRREEEWQAAGEAVVREMELLVPEEAGAPLRAAWRGASLGEALVEQVKQEQASVRDEVNGLVEAAAAEAKKAQQAAAEAQASWEGAQDSVQKLEVVQAFISVFEGKIQSAIVANDATGTWWVGGIDLGQPYRGEAGKAPIVGTNGNWLTWDGAAWQDTGYNAAGQDGFSPYVNAAGHWVTRDPVTGHIGDNGLAAAGRDGRDGASVRRILIDSAAELPTEGETCCGGVYYYVPIRSAAASGWIRLDTYPQGGDWLSINGAAITLPNDGLSPELFAALINAAGCGVTASVSQEDSVKIVLTADVAGAAGNEIAIDLGDNPSGLTQSGDTLTGGEDAREGYYDVYAWLELLPGEASWHRVGEVHDIATTEIFGLVKLSTDTLINDGAPVGRDASGGLRVPLAEFTLPGSVLPSASTASLVGGTLYRDAAGALWATPASASEHGAVRLSMAEEAAVPCIGLMADGSVGLRWATLTQGGAVKLGSAFGHLNTIPYQQGIGATSNHELANNLLFGGALKHMKRSGWSATAMDWLSAHAESEYYNGNDYYTGLHTSNQFDQTQEKGLVLLSATGSLLAGVYLAATLDDARGNAVPSAGTVKSWVQAYAYAKADTYTRTEIDAKDKAVSDSVAALKAEVGATYLTKSEAGTLYETKTAAKSAHQTLQNAVNNCVAKRANWHGNEYLTQAEYNALPSIDPLIEYNILEG